jgi:hypothetical protein
MGGSILHITNGDSTTNYLKKLNISGTFITWREMLCEGKTISDIGSERFWKTRFDFLKISHKISKQKFINYTLKEYRNLCNEKKQDEIVLWFQQDLYCQINLIAVLSWLKRYRKGYQISLICSEKATNSKKLPSFSELTAGQINQQFNNRIELNIDDVEYADYIWQLYCSDSPLRLEIVYQANPASPFHYLATALEAHLKRFPSIENGLNNVENFILKTADKKKTTSKKKFIDLLLKDQEVYGFAALQYEQKIGKLQHLFSSLNPVKLTKTGKQVLEQQVNFYGKLRSDFSYLGGAKKYSFLFDNETNKLLQITS